MSCNYQDGIASKFKLLYTRLFTFEGMGSSISKPAKSEPVKIIDENPVWKLCCVKLLKILAWLPRKY